MPLEYRGLTCETHGMGAFERERGTVAPWACCECVEAAAHPHVLAEMAAEKPRAPEPRAFKAGDWVVCVDASGSADELTEGLCCRIVAVGCEGRVRSEEADSYWEPSRFRPATPAEVAAAEMSPEATSMLRDGIAAVKAGRVASLDFPAPPESAAIAELREGHAALRKVIEDNAACAARIFDHHTDRIAALEKQLRELTGVLKREMRTRIPAIADACDELDRRNSAAAGGYDSDCYVDVFAERDAHWAALMIQTKACHALEQERDKLAAEMKHYRDSVGELDSKGEPKIVRGALDAQAEAESRMFAMCRELQKANAMGATCTCGSGGHPRRCIVHPEAFDEHCAELSVELAEQSNEPVTVGATNRAVRPAIDIARGLVEGMRNDERGDHLRRDFDDELAARIADIIEGERQRAREVFGYYGMASEPSNEPEAPDGSGELPVTFSTGDWVVCQKHACSKHSSGYAFRAPRDGFVSRDGYRLATDRESAKAEVAEAAIEAAEAKPASEALTAEWVTCAIRTPGRFSIEQGVELVERFANVRADAAFEAGREGRDDVERQLAERDAEIARLRAANEALRSTCGEVGRDRDFAKAHMITARHLADPTAAWRWMATDDNRLETMAETMTVMMTAGTLRGLLRADIARTLAAMIPETAEEGGGHGE